MDSFTSPFIIDLAQIAGTRLCVSGDDGQKVCTLIEQALLDGRAVELRFGSVTTLSTTFLNSAIGQLYGRHDEAFLRAHLQAPDISPSQRALLSKVVENAKRFFADPEQFERHASDVLEAV